MKTQRDVAQVNPFSAVPRYYQLKDILLQKIENGEWLPAQAIPSERELETLYNVSRTTIRKALDILVSKGYLYREHGRGTFVAYPRLQQSLHSLTSFTDDMKRRGLEPGQRLLSMEYVEPSLRIRKLLHLAPEIERLPRIERLRLGNGEPVGLHTAYIALGPNQPLTADELIENGSLYDLLYKKYNILIIDADETLEATSADEVEAGLLQIQPGEPLLLIERVSWSQERVPVEFVQMLYRADRYKYYVHLSREL